MSPMGIGMAIGTIAIAGTNGATVATTTVIATTKATITATAITIATAAKAGTETDKVLSKSLASSPGISDFPQ